MSKMYVLLVPAEMVDDFSEYDKGKWTLSPGNEVHHGDFEAGVRSSVVETVAWHDGDANVYDQAEVMIDSNGWVWMDDELVTELFC